LQKKILVDIATNTALSPVFAEDNNVVDIA
jgi:hypothetical protein